MDSRRAFFLLLSVGFGLCSALAYEGSGPPDYAAILSAASLVIEARVEEVRLPKKLSDPTEIVLLVRNVQKGASAQGTAVRVFHESGEASAKTENGLTSAQFAARCPAFPSFRVGEEVRVYAQWDARAQRFFVPSHSWKVELK